MADPKYTCSISRQDCAQYNANFSTFFDSTSCVKYEPWYTRDQGACGWVGAPCSVQNQKSNCNVNNTLVCNSGQCGFGLGDDCSYGYTRLERCNGLIGCGSDERCGGKGARVSIVDNLTPEFAKQVCISGVLGQEGNSWVCGEPPHSPGKSNKVRLGIIIGPTIAAFAVLLAIVLWYRENRKSRAARTSRSWSSTLPSSPKGGTTSGSKSRTTPSSSKSGTVPSNASGSASRGDKIEVSLA